MDRRIANFHGLIQQPLAGQFAGLAGTSEITQPALKVSSRARVDRPLGMTVQLRSARSKLIAALVEKMPNPKKTVSRSEMANGARPAGLLCLGRLPLGRTVE
jgi:hypothetical protein